MKQSCLIGKTKSLWVDGFLGRLRKNADILNLANLTKLSICKVMEKDNIQDAKIQFSRLLKKNVKPETSLMTRFGFIAEQISVPDDFDSMGEAEIIKLFEDNK